MIIIDASNQLNRVLQLPSYFGLQFAGKPTGGIYGFLRILNNIALGAPQGEKIIVVWDGGRSKRRLELFPEYKANRAPKNEEEKKIKEEYFKSYNPQKQALQELFLPSLGVLSLVHQQFEADDVIFKLTELFHKDNNIMIVSEDKDMLQLMTHFPDIKVKRPIAEQLVTKDNFKDVAEVPKELFLLYKALLGDKSDNIGGVYGVGEVTLKKLIGELKSTTQEEAIKEILTITKKKYDDSKDKEKLSREAKIYKDWGTVSRNLELVDLSRENFSGSDVQSFKSCVNDFKPKLYRNHFKSLCVEHGFNSLLTEFDFWIRTFEIICS